MKLDDLHMDFQLLVDQLHRWQLEPSPDERCAVLRGYRASGGGFHVLMVEEVPNRHPYPQHSFKISRGDVADPDTVIGVIHTHLEGWDTLPSRGDIAGLLDGMFGLIWNTESRTLTLYDQHGWQAELLADSKRMRSRL